MQNTNRGRGAAHGINRGGGLGPAGGQGGPQRGHHGGVDDDDDADALLNALAPRAAASGPTGVQQAAAATTGRNRGARRTDRGRKINKTEVTSVDIEVPTEESMQRVMNEIGKESIRPVNNIELTASQRRLLETNAWIDPDVVAEVGMTMRKADQFKEMNGVIRGKQGLVTFLLANMIELVKDATSWDEAAPRMPYVLARMERIARPVYAALQGLYKVQLYKDRQAEIDAIDPAEAITRAKLSYVQREMEIFKRQTSEAESMLAGMLTALQQELTPDTQMEPIEALYAFRIVPEPDEDAAAEADEEGAAGGR